MKSIASKCIFLLIIVCALFLRTYIIDKNPPSLSWDEVSIGYNAYSILKTGKDEHGKFLPIDTFVAYGDYKPPLAIYLTVPFVATFGLNELAVRLPSALFGTATVFLVFFLVKELFKPYEKKLNVNLFAFVTTFVLAISPWHINLSRAGFEANIALFLVVSGTWLILSTREHSKRWIVAWLPFVAGIYTFNSTRYFVFFLGVALMVYLFHSIKKHLNFFIIGSIIAVICVLPILPHLLSNDSRLRFEEVNIFTDSSIVETANKRIAYEGNSIIAKLINNRRVGYARSFFIHFADNLEPDFLFIKGDGNPKFSIQDVGELYLVEAPFLVIGIFALFIDFPVIAGLLLYWLLTAIIPAATARETPHALRILNSLPTWQIYISYGILKSVSYVSRIKIKRGLFKYSFISLIAVLYICSIAYYLHNYYDHYPEEYSGEWQYGYKQALQIVSKIQSKYKTVVISDIIGRPYMYTLFYMKTDPKSLFKSVDANFDAAGFYHVYGFEKYRFGGTLPVDLDPRTLYVWDAGSVPKGVRVIDTVRLLNGNPVLEVFDSGTTKL